MARKSGPVSIYSIAKELGISPSAVSRAVNNRAGVSEETRRNVMTLLRKYNFRTNYPQQRKPKIAIVSQRTLISQYVATVTSGIHDYVSENALSICSIVYDHEHDTEPLLSAIRDQQCSGVIVLNADDFKNDLSELNSSGLPVMLVDLPSQYPNIGFIDNDSYHGFHTATQHLLQLGHRRIGYLNPRKSFNHHQRFRGYCDAMHEAGLEIPDHWIQDRDPDELKTDIHHGAGMLSRLLDAAPELTAVMAANDNFALGALHAAQERGIRIPDDLSIVGFDDYSFSAFLNPPLTTVLHPAEEAGRLAALSIDRFLKTGGREPLLREMLPTELIVRGSTTPPRR